MNIDSQHITTMRSLFQELRSKDDLAGLLSESNRYIYGEKAKPVKVKSLNYFANPAFCKQRYKTFHIEKKTGGSRTIHAPVKGLKSILRSLNYVLHCMHEPKSMVTGFVPGKSIVDNAKPHAGKNYVLNMDLQDFFHSFDRNRVKLGFMQDPFNLRGDKEPLAFFLACLCTHPIEVNGELRTVLPQGSPTSPTLSNILCSRLDRRLNGLAKRFGLVYTRYADDLTFSSDHNVYHLDEFNNELHRIVENDQKLKFNPSKTRLQKSGYRQEVTGLVVNEKVNVKRQYKKDVRMWEYYINKYSIEKATELYNKDLAGSLNEYMSPIKFKKVIMGKKDFYCFVKNGKKSISKNSVNSILYKFFNFIKDY